MKLNAKELRVSKPTKADLKKIKRRQIYIICDNILDTYNIGSIFRLADAVAASCVFLCGQTATPPYHRIAKAAVGTEKWVPWQHFASAKAAIEKLKGQFSNVIASTFDELSINSAKQSKKEKIATSRKSGTRNDQGRFKVIAIEQSSRSVDYRKADLGEPVAFIVGHETSGVSKEALKLADQIVEIPMFGVNRSLNVMVSLAIILFKTIENYS